MRTGLTKIHHNLHNLFHDHIQLNTNFRTHANNDFEKNLYKLINNAVFGKIIENVRNHVDVRLLTCWDGRYAEAMIVKSNFHSRNFHNRFGESSSNRNRGNLTIYMGMYILDIFETYLYEFHHDYISSREI